MFKIVIYGLVLLSFTSNIFAQSKLSVHGFLSQAFAISDSYQIFGISEKGTFDYRTLALQFRYDIDEKNSSIVQFSHRRIGQSPLMDLESDIKIDWAFFEHKLNNNFGFKIGKILIPFGLYNEIRDIGILLPFYRVPYTPYSMGSYLSESVNGVSAYYITSYLDWKINFDIYVGNWNWTAWFNQEDPFEDGILTIMDISSVERGVGARLNIDSPYDWLTSGFSWQRGEASGEVFFSKNYGGIGNQDFNSLNMFIDIDFELFYLKSEYTRILLTQGKFFMEGSSLIGGFNPIGKFWANFTFEYINLIDVPNYDNDDPTILKNRRDSNYLRDFAVGLNYKFTSNIILKSELHFNKSLAVENKYVHVFKDEPKDIRYFILSLATSF